MTPVLAAYIAQSIGNRPALVSDFVAGLMASNGGAGTTHLKLLASVARLLMKADVKEALLGATTAEQLEEVLNSHLAG